MTQAPIRFLMVPLAAFLLSATARADIFGSIWEFPNDTIPGNAIPANVPATTPDVTFHISGTTQIFFTSGGAYTIGEFLNSEATHVAGSSVTVDSGAAKLTNTLDDTLFNFTGSVTVTNGQSFTAGHDDGLTLVIGGTTVISAPGGTAFAVTTGTYNGPSGTFPFQLVYGEGFGAPGDLEISGFNLVGAPPSVPEPSSVVLTITALLGVALVARKRFASV